MKSNNSPIYSTKYGPQGVKSIYISVLRDELDIHVQDIFSSGTYVFYYTMRKQKSWLGKIYDLLYKNKILRWSYLTPK